VLEVIANCVCLICHRRIQLLNDLLFVFDCSLCFCQCLGISVFKALCFELYVYTIHCVILIDSIPIVCNTCSYHVCVCFCDLSCPLIYSGHLLFFYVCLCNKSKDCIMENGVIKSNYSKLRLIIELTRYLGLKQLFVTL